MTDDTWATERDEPATATWRVPVTLPAYSPNMSDDPNVPDADPDAPADPDADPDATDDDA